MTLDTDLVGITPLSKARVVQLTTPVEREGELVLRFLIGVDAVFVRFDAHGTLV